MLFDSTAKLEAQMDAATTYEEWCEAAQAHDAHTGMDKWKRMDQTRLYDHVELRARLDRLRSLRVRRDDHGLLFALNEGIHGNMAGMGQPMLYTRAKFSTKQLIQDYVDEVVDALEHLADPETTDISFEEKLDFFRRASHCFGRTALMLSGGGMLGNYHMGVVKALIEEELLPDIISGSSAGSFVAAVLGTHTNEELEKLFEPGNLEFEAKSEANWFNRMLTGRHPQIDVHDFESLVSRLVPDLTFQEAFEKTGRHINISVAPAELHQTSRLLNAITSPNVFIRKAVLASGAVPGVFPPVMLEAKNVHGERQPYLPTRKWVDGSVYDDLPAKRLARLYGVNHYIVSLVNPLVLPWIRDPKTESTLSGQAVLLGERWIKEWIRGSVGLTKTMTRDMPRLNLILTMWSSIATQTYTADINIIPRVRLFDPRRLLSPPSEEEVLFFVAEGEKATWPKIEMIRTCTKISRHLDHILRNFEQREMELALETKQAKRASSGNGGAKKTTAKRPSRKSGGTGTKVAAKGRKPKTSKSTKNGSAVLVATGHRPTPSV